jgi:uncharacterized protein YbjT (DUF2867 family)
MIVCVTGATGFLGAHWVRSLRAQDHEVRVTYRDPKRLGQLGELEIRPARADIADYRALRRAFRGAEVVFHAAGYVGSRRSTAPGESTPRGRSRPWRRPQRRDADGSS